jgi:hypothetical protein
MEVDHTTPEAEAFRRAYQGVVDATPPAADLPDLGPTARLAPQDGKRRQVWAAVSAAALVIVVVGAVVWIRPPADTAESRPVSYTPYVLLGDDVPPDLRGTLHVRIETVVEEGTVEGELGLVPPVGSVIREMAYSSPAGSFGVVSIDGFAISPTDLVAAFPGSEAVMVNGHEALLVRADDLTWAVIWTPESDLTVATDSSELSAEELVSIARAVESTTEAAWNSLQLTSPSSEEFIPTAQGGAFEPVSEPILLASGEGWAAWAQVVKRSETRPGTSTYLCEWIDRDGLAGPIDLGCGDEIGGYWPAFGVADGLVQVAEFDPAVAEVRIAIGDEEPTVVTPVLPHPSSPGVVIAVLLPAKGSHMVMTVFDKNGDQLDADPQNERLERTLTPSP